MEILVRFSTVIDYNVCVKKNVAQDEHFKSLNDFVILKQDLRGQPTPKVNGNLLDLETKDHLGVNDS